MLTIEQFEEDFSGEGLCEYCRYSREGCRGMSSSGNGEPSYPPCADHPKEIIEKAYERYIEEEDE